MTFSRQDEVRLAEDLRALRAGKRFPWPHVGELLDMAGSSGYWRTEGASSFSGWIRGLAHSLSYRESSLWRYRSAVREYKRVSTELRSLGIEVPPREALADVVSPENIELLSKLARVAPQNLLGSLARRIVHGEITREELRHTWRTFRPALGGRTARGRGARRPQINHRDPQQCESVREALIFNALEVSTGAWTGHEESRLYEVFMHVRSEAFPELHPGIVFDAVVVIRTGRDPLEIHGLECLGGDWPDESLPTKLTRASEYCDYLWVVEHEEGHGIQPNQVPVGVGMAQVKGSQVEATRPATSTPRPVRYREAMLSSLLTIALEE